MARKGLLIALAIYMRRLYLWAIPKNEVVGFRPSYTPLRDRRVPPPPWK
jgi:hypothetical protein